MSSLYQKRSIYYLSVTYKGRNITRSLGTSVHAVAKKLQNDIETELLYELISGKPKKQNLPINKLVELFMAADHNWSDSTRRIYDESFRRYIKHGFPATNYKAMIVRNLNTLYKWAYENNLVLERKRFSGGSKFTKRTRVFTPRELTRILNDIKPPEFQNFICFAYYTGARRGEIARISPENIKGNALLVKGKTGTRRVKITPQAKKYQFEYNYKPEYITRKFKSELRRLGIDGRFHDLRRTFGLNCLRKGLGIETVSKLLGHSNIQVTSDHYTPFTVDDIDDFEL